MLNRFIRNSYAQTFFKAIQMHFNRSQQTGPPRRQTKSKNAKQSQTASTRMKRFWQSTQMSRCSALRGRPEYTLLSYNILAQDLLIEHSQLYYNTEPQWLRWEHRLRRLCQEIVNIRPDILCLQEMQYNHLKVLVKRIRGKRQLEYIFKKKTGHRTDGCAIIYDSKKLKLLDDHGVEYYTQDVHPLDRENVAIMAKFKTLQEPSTNFVVVTTHLLYNPRRHDVRCAQVDKLLESLDQFAVVGDGSECTTLPAIVSGDFNCIPYSQPYCRLITSALDRDRGQCNNATGGERQQEARIELVAIPFGDEGNIASAFQGEWIVVDHVLHTPHTVQVRSVYTLPTIMDCIQMGDIPNRLLGSDHYSLAIRFSVS